MNDNETRVVGVFRIGNGKMLHPAIKDKSSGWIALTCGCPNTSNGFGVSGGSFFENIAPTCKRSKRLSK